MRTIFSRSQKQSDFAQEVLMQKVRIALVDHVYSQAHLVIGSSFFCAVIVFIGLFSTQQEHTVLIGWAIFFTLITLLRFGLLYGYKKSTSLEHMQHVKRWNNLYVIGAALGGFSWGLTAFILLPSAASIGKILLILMLAGLTGGVVPLTSAIPLASASFLVITIVPFIIVFALFRETTYLLFDAALTLYLAYSITITFKIYQLIKNSILLRFENDDLLESIFDAKQQLELTNKKLEHTATHDSLTQAANRSLFHTNLENAVKRAKIDNSSIALLYMDLDRFKLVNDAYGHNVGDKLLIYVIERLNGFLDKDSFIARWGGDEITIILQNITSVQQVEQIAGALCRLIATPIRFDKIDLKISASIGISMYPQDGADVASLLWHADKAMYFVKEHGGNHFAFFSNLREFESS